MSLLIRLFVIVTVALVEAWPASADRSGRGPVAAAARRGLIFHLLGLLLASGLAAQESPLDAEDPGSELTVYVMTMGPGDRVWEMFGHNAIWIADAKRGTEVVYTWGYFDFRQTDFIPRFLKGQMYYLMVGEPPARALATHRRRNRLVTAQELNLTPAQRLELRRFLELHAQPENAFYRYDYFLDNCSTRLRDALDRVLDGQLEAALAGRTTGATWRYHTRRITQGNLAVYAGMDFLLGSRGDRPISVWEEMFVPMVVRDVLRDLSVTQPDGRQASLVVSERLLFEAQREQEPAAPGRLTPAFFGAGLVLAATLAGLAWLGWHGGAFGRLGRAGFLTLGVAWSLLAGLTGLLLVAVLVTDHQFMYWNVNLFYANPLHLALAALLPTAVYGGRTRAVASRSSQLLASISLLGVILQLLPGVDQGNGPVIAVALPAHVALAWALSFIPRRR